MRVHTHHYLPVRTEASTTLAEFLEGLETESWIPEGFTHREYCLHLVSRDYKLTQKEIERLRWEHEIWVPAEGHRVAGVLTF